MSTLLTVLFVLIVVDNTYHIPICIWLMDTHPYNAPLAYVQPTAEMQIKVSMYVDHNGKIYLPYLHDWNPVGFSFLVKKLQRMQSYRFPTFELFVLHYSHRQICWVSYK